MSLYRVPLSDACATDRLCHNILKIACLIGFFIVCLEVEGCGFLNEGSYTQAQLAFEVQSVPF